MEVMSSEPPAVSASKGQGLRAVVEEGAGEALEQLGQGLREAQRALAAPEATDLAPLLPHADLPELGGTDPLAALGVRLDREGDLWRSLALRGLGRIAWVDRTTQGVAVAAAVGEVAIAAVAAMSAVLGAEHAGARAVLFGIAAVVVMVGASVVAVVARGIRSTQKELADSALARAEAVEHRLARLAIVLEWKRSDAALYQDALARFEGTGEG